ncbi:MAG: hypothetical protein R3C59_19780 [Planctomycetaceae bacterium]
MSELPMLFFRHSDSAVIAWDRVREWLNRALVVAVTVGTLVSYGAAQEVVIGSADDANTISQRRLPLPSNGTSDLQKQMFLMKQLRAMLLGQQPVPDAGQSKSAPDSADALKDKLKSLRDKIPPEMRPLLDNLPPGLIGQAMNDPELKQQMKQHLEQYSRDRQIPDGNGGGRMPLPKSDDTPANSKATADSTTNAPQNSGNNRSGDSAQPQRGKTEGRDEPTPTPNDQPTDVPNTPKPPDQSTQGALERLRDFWNKQTGNANRPEPRSNNQRSDVNRSTPESNNSPASSGGASGASGNPGQPQPSPGATKPDTDKETGSAPPNKAFPNGPLPNNPREWDQLLDDLIRRQRGEPLSPRSDAEDTDSRGAQRNGGASNGRSSDKASGLPSVQEFLELMKDVSPSDLPGNAAADNSSSSSEGSPETAKTQAEVAEDIRRKQEETKSNLKRFGLEQTLKRIVRDAQQEVREKNASSQSPGGDPAAGERTSDSGVSEAMLRVVKGVGKDLLQMMKDGKLKVKPADGGKSASNGRSVSQSARPPSATESMFREIRDSTSEFLSDMAAPDVPSAAASDSASVALSDNLPTASWSSWVAGVAVLAVLIALLMWRTGVIDPAKAAAAGSRLLTGDDLRSKADVVRAFHRLALHPHRSTEEWWTHQMVVDDIRESSPEKTYQIQVLAELYEQARYLPDEAEFTQEQIQEAKAALKRCES